MNPSPAKSPNKEPAEEAGHVALRTLARLLARVAAEKDCRDLVGNETESCDRVRQEPTHD